MSSDALELALALHHAPIQRFALRARPLPGRMDEVLQLASAAQPQLDAAAARFSEKQETVVEAVRFYLHQILFEPGTDAYRILGVEPGADFAQIRQHHVWLQRWLHPDRRGEDWEGALAVKVNWAWQQLRSDSVRKNYDLSRQQTSKPNTLETSDIAPMQGRAWVTESVYPRRYWLRRLVMGSLLVSCAGLFYLAATRQDPVDADNLAAHLKEARERVHPRMPLADASLQHSNPGTLDQTRLISQTERIDIAELLITPPSSSNRVDSPVFPGAGPVRVRGKNEPVTKIVNERKDAASVDLARPAGSGQPSAAEVSEPALTITPGSAPMGSDASFVSADRPLQQSQAVLTNSADDRPDSNQRIASASGDSPRRIAIQSLHVGSTSPGRTGLASSAGGIGATIKSDGEDGEASAQKIIVIETDVRSSSLPLVIGPPVVIDSDLATISSRTRVPSANLLKPAVVVSPRSREIESATLRRFELARDRVRSVVGYFSRAEGSAPRWNDERSRHQVVRERSSLLQRRGQLQDNRFALDPPVWKISHSAASINATYHLGSKRSSTESGRFVLEMVWAEDDWAITHIELSPEL